MSLVVFGTPGTSCSPNTLIRSQKGVEIGSKGKLLKTCEQPTRISLLKQKGKVDIKETYRKENALPFKVSFRRRGVEERTRLELTFDVRGAPTPLPLSLPFSNWDPPLNTFLAAFPKTLFRLLLGSLLGFGSNHHCAWSPKPQFSGRPYRHSSACTVGCPELHARPGSPVRKKW